MNHRKNAKNERTNERMNERMNERTNERTKERTNERTNERMNEWSIERSTDERMNLLLFESLNILLHCSNAWCCRIVTSALKCFHDIMSKKITEQCGMEGAEEYRKSYVEPLVEQSRDTVVKWCKLAPDLNSDFTAVASRLPVRSNNALLLLTVWVTFAFTRSHIRTQCCETPVSPLLHFLV